MQSIAPSFDTLFRTPTCQPTVRPVLVTRASARTIADSGRTQRSTSRERSRTTRMPAGRVGRCPGLPFSFLYSKRGRHNQNKYPLAPCACLKCELHSFGVKATFCDCNTKQQHGWCAIFVNFFFPDRYAPDTRQAHGRSSQRAPSPSLCRFVPPASDVLYRV